MYLMGEEEIEAISRIIKGRKLFRNQGPQVSTECRKFEEEFSKHLNSGPTLLVNSGTSALLNALKACDVGVGDEVIIPCFTYVATAAAVIQAGAIPVIANIDETLTICPDDIERKITSKTRAIIPVHMEGLPCEMTRIMKIAEKYKLVVIEDVAQAAGGSFKGKKLGTFGDAGCFSFNADKIITAGEGGAVVFKEEGSFKNGLLFHDSGVSFGPTYRDYLQGMTPLPGVSMRVSEITGAMMRVQLMRLEKILSLLRARKKIFHETLSQVGQRIVLSHDSSGDCGTSLILQLDNPTVISKLSQKLQSDGILAYPLSARPAHSYWQWKDMIPEAQRASDLSRSKLILAGCLKIPMETDWSLAESEIKANKVLSALKTP